MSAKVLSLGVLFLCVAQVGCAASSNGGGLVVGNPLVSESSVSAKKGCDCTTVTDPATRKSCKCPAVSVTGSKTSTSTSTATKTGK